MPHQYQLCELRFASSKLSGFIEFPQVLGCH
jgi:hypothetical protein